MKTMRHPQARALLVQPHEHQALLTAAQTLRELQFALGGENTIMSLETGEVICPGEIARAISALEFVATYRMVEVNPV